MLPAKLTGFSSKAYLTVAQADAWIDTVATTLSTNPDKGEGAYVCVPFPLIDRFRDGLADVSIDIGTQDVSAFPAGPYTGEVSAELLAELGVRYTMVGHPERRKNLGETDEVVRAKIEAAVGVGIVPILVCGENSRDDDPGPALQTQIETAFGGLASDAEVIAAYEPTWAIGQAEAAPPEHVAAATGVLRAILDDVVPQARIVYGGSAVPGTYAAIAAAAQQDSHTPDGIFLGRGGLDPARFLNSLEEVRKASRPNL